MNVQVRFVNVKINWDFDSKKLNIKRTTLIDKSDVREISRKYLKTLAGNRQGGQLIIFVYEAYVHSINISFYSI